ncbi:MAG: methyltransferase (TIGR00027 family) [Myxococcota bacterium]|jgi:methyltransferase (TIGR00027 family)
MDRTRPSHTAVKIARMSLYFTMHRVLGPLMPPGMSDINGQILSAAGLMKPWHQRVYRSRVFDGIVRAADRLMPGALAHMALRKRFFDDEVGTALDEGARQIVVLGAGLDGLAVRRASQHPDARFWELDHPVTQPAKRDAVVAAGLTADNLVLLPADLGERPLDALLAAQPAWDSSAAALFTAEGLFMYLEPPAVRALLEAAHRACGPGSRLVFSWLPAGDGGRDGLGHTLRASLAVVGEPVRWRITRPELDVLLGETGWRPCGEPDRLSLSDRYLAGSAMPVTGIEAVMVADRV